MRASVNIIRKKAIIQTSEPQEESLATQMASAEIVCSLVHLPVVMGKDASLDKAMMKGS